MCVWSLIVVVSWMVQRRALGLAPLIALWAVVGAWAISSLWAPLGWDQGIFAFVGDGVARGGLPYRDVWDPKGPLTYLPWALMRACTGPTMWGPRLFDLGVLAVGCASLFRLIARLIGRRAAAYAAGGLALSYAAFRTWNVLQPDGWSALLLIFAFAPLIDGPGLPSGSADARGQAPGVDDRAPTRGDMLRAGAVIGACTLFKPFLAGYLLVPAAVLWHTGTLRLRLRALVIGFIVPIALMLAWFASNHALDALVDGYLRWNAESMKDALPWRAGIAHTYWYLIDHPEIVVLLPFACVGLIAAYQRAPRAGLVLGLWLAIGYGGVYIQRRYYHYHWHLIVPQIVALAAFGIAHLWRLAAPASTVTRPQAVLGAVLAVGLAAYHPVHDIALWASHISGARSTEDYYAAIDREGAELYRHDGFAAARDLRVAAFLREHTAPDERVFVWSDPLVNYLADRPGLVRVPTGRPYIDWASLARRQLFRDELLGALRDHPPRYLVVLERSLANADARDPLNLSLRFPEFVTVLETRYRLDRSIGDFRIYALR